MKKIIIWGTGNYFERYYKYIKACNVVAVVDNNSSKWNTYIYEYKIYSPEIIKDIEYDYIYICSIYCNEIKNQLLDMKIKKEKIHYYFDFKQISDDYKFYPNNNHGNQKKIALISHDFSITGAQNCLLTVSKYLNSKGYHVIVGTPYDGDMKSEFYDTGAEIYVDRRLRMGTLKSLEWINECDMIFVNTVQLYYLLRDKNNRIPIIWWIHEPLMLYSSVVSDILERMSLDGVDIYSVSEISDRAFKNNIKNIKLNRLLYGIQDKIDDYFQYETNKEKCVSDYYIRIIQVGEICELKGQIILLKALSLLNDKEKKRIKLYFVGNDKSKYSIKLKSSNLNADLAVEYVGIQEHQQTLHLISMSDVVVCASKSETMSMAISEGMMYGKIVIASDACGIAEYIMNGENGFIFKSQDCIELMKKIVYVLNCDKKELNQIKKKSRETFKKKFDLPNFYDKLDGLMNNI